MNLIKYVQILFFIKANSLQKIIYLLNIRVINSVGSECHVDNVEVTGSNPV